jgi:hypothetical protein
MLVFLTKLDLQNNIDLCLNVQDKTDNEVLHSMQKQSERH